MDETDRARWHSLGAFRGCDAHDREHGINYTAVTEAHGPTAVVAMIAAGDHAGKLCPAAGYHANGEDQNSDDRCYATLDVLAEDGDILTDRCIPTREAFEWWVRAVELRADMADCPVDEPSAHAWTYA